MVVELISTKLFSTLKLVNHLSCSLSIKVAARPLRWDVMGTRPLCWDVMGTLHFALLNNFTFLLCWKKPR